MPRHVKTRAAQDEREASTVSKLAQSHHAPADWKMHAQMVIESWADKTPDEIATEHLLALGHRRIALLPGSTLDLAGLERLLGCQQALSLAGITPDAGLVRQSGWNVDEAYEATRTLLAERRDFTAVVAGSDFMAIGVLRALTEQGLTVPDDVSLVGFDDIEYCHYTAPPLTTVRQDPAAKGRGAVQRLIALIEGAEKVSPLILPTQLVVRNSTGPVPGGLH